jgi:hypothetical protein
MNSKNSWKRKKTNKSYVEKLQKQAKITGVEPYHYQ